MREQTDQEMRAHALFDLHDAVRIMNEAIRFAHKSGFDVEISFIKALNQGRVMKFLDCRTTLVDE